MVRPFAKGDSAEIGSGSGYFFFPLCEFLAGRGTCYAIELQPEMLAHFEDQRKRLEKALPIKTLLGPADHIDRPDHSLELVWMVNVFHELSHPKEILQDIYRVLVPSGQMLVVDWKKEDTPVGPPVDERASEVSLYDHLISAGFTRIRSHDIYPYHYVVEALKD